MMLGVSAALLVFTGVWHLTEWMMGGRNKDTLLLIPFGVAYALLGALIAGGAAGVVTLGLTLAITCIGITGALVTRSGSLIRPWVLWAFILIDVVIIIGLLSGLLGLL